MWLVMGILTVLKLIWGKYVGKEGTGASLISKALDSKLGQSLTYSTGLNCAAMNPRMPRT
jgi:hypothetical protein